MSRREIVVPMIPDVEGEDDTSYFEEYDDEEEHSNRVRLLVLWAHASKLSSYPTCAQIAAQDQDKFADF